MVATSFNSIRAQSIYFHSEKEIVGPGEYDLTTEGNYVGVSDKLTQCIYGGPDNSVQNGVLTITKLDTEKRIIAGRFHFTLTSPTCSTITVTDGRFDVIY